MATLGPEIEAQPEDLHTKSRRSTSVPSTMHGSKPAGDLEKIKQGRKISEGRKIPGSETASSSSFNLSMQTIASMSRRRNSKYRWSSYNRFGIFRPSQPQITRKMENSYQLEPSDKNRFSPSKVKAVIQDSLHFYLSNKTAYNGRECGLLSKSLANDIKQRVKLLGYTRYRLVVEVNIGQHLGQDLEVASRCLWDTANDNSATAIYETGDIFAIASVFGIYFE